MSTPNSFSKRSKKKSEVVVGKGMSARGRRFTSAQRKHALDLIASGMKREQVAEAIGTTVESLRRWMRVAEEAGTMPSSHASVAREEELVGEAHQAEEQGESSASDVRSTSLKPGSIYAPRDPGQGLSSDEQTAILDLKKKHPSMGPAQIRAQLKRFKGWRMSNKAIAKVLRDNGYELVHRGSRPQGASDHRFEAPRRNAMWQMDFGEFRVAGEKLHLLVAVDDFSRYAVGHTLGSSPSSRVATKILREAMARHGKPEAVRTDRGGAFLAKEEEDDFARVLEVELIDHIVGYSYHPQGGGKVESMVGTVRRELWDVEHFDSVDEARRRVDEFFEDYNNSRAHMGIDGLTPADRFFGRADRVLAAVDAISRGRQGAAANRLAAGAPFEEALGIRTGAPLEVLRLVIADGKMELRFCGTRVCLGEVH